MSETLSNDPGLRLALRLEGGFWVAYLAQIRTMEGALQLGTICIAAVDRDAGLRRDFMDLMKRVAAQHIGDALGAQPIAWQDPEPAPEHEKAGHS